MCVTFKLACIKQSIVGLVLTFPFFFLLLPPHSFSPFLNSNTRPCSMSSYGTTASHDEESQRLLRNVSSRTQANDTFYGRTKVHIHTNRKRYFALWLLALAAAVSIVVGLFYYHKQHHHKDDPFAPNSLLAAARPDGDVCKSDRSYGVTVILSVFFGYIAVDRFYLGYIFTGILKLVTGTLQSVLFGFWVGRRMEGGR